MRMWLLSGITIMILAVTLTACGENDESGTASSESGVPAAQATENALATAFARHELAQAQPTATPFAADGSPATVSGDEGTENNSPNSPSPTTITVTESPVVTATSTIIPSTSTPTATRVTPTPVAYASIDALTGEHYWLARPFYPDRGYVAATSYLYGVRRSDGQLNPHHGLDFQAEHGAIVSAAGSGKVYYAGTDHSEVRFGPSNSFYGNVIVIEHNIPMPETGEIYTLYTLYGHLSAIYVQEGEKVQQFEPIGEVGMTGIAQGPHLHFEVRIGDPLLYQSTYNPGLWLIPQDGYGVLAGQVRTSDGEMIAGAEVRIIDVVTGATVYTGTYEPDAEVNSNPWHRENFVVPALVVGRSYEVQINYLGRQIARREVTILPDKTTMIYVSVQS